MNREKHPYLLAYDIASPERLRAVAHVAEDFGMRIQYSVFIAHLTPVMRDRLLSKLERIINAREDDVRLYPLPKKPYWETHGRGTWLPGVWLSAPWPDHDDEDGGLVD